MSFHSEAHIVCFSSASGEMKNIMYTQGWQIDFSLWVHILVLRIRKKYICTL